MTNQHYIQQAIDYIEDNIQADITPNDVATIAGFSLYHFYHLFKFHIGMPVQAYISKRRIVHALYAVQEGMTITEATLTFGFNTHAGFYKACKRLYGCNAKKLLSLEQFDKPKRILLKEIKRMSITNNQLKAVLKHWNIEAVTSLTPAQKGGGHICDDVWLVNDTYVLKASSEVATLTDTIQLYNAMQKSIPNIKTALFTTSNEQTVKSDDYYFALYPATTGAYLTPQERYSGDLEATGYQYGEAIAKLHQSMQLLDNEDFLNNQDFLKVVKDWALPKTKKIMEQWGQPLPDNFYEDFLTKFPPLFKDLIKQAIHRDVNPSNILFKDGQVTGFIDFELTEKNIRLFDPCYCATGILSEATDIEDGYSKWPSLLKGIIKAYNAQMPLNDAEKQAIPYVIYGIQMIFIAYLDREEHKELLARNREMLMWIWENKETCFNQLV